MSKLDIQYRIAELKTKRNEDVSINVEYALKRLVEKDQMDVLYILNSTGELKPVRVVHVGGESGDQVCSLAG